MKVLAARGVIPRLRGMGAPEITVCCHMCRPSCVLSSAIVLPSANLCARFVPERPMLNFSRFLALLAAETKCMRVLNL